MFGTQDSYTNNAVQYTYYTYRPDGLRHSIGNTIHLWDGANIVADVNGNTITTYFRGINLIYAEKNGSQTYYHFNAHGDVVVLTNASGTKTKTYSYSAFGVEYNPGTYDTNPFRYCGEYYDTVSGTIYLRARYYNADLGRFTQQDGWEFENPEDPLSLNLYTYCWSNPVMYMDYTGQIPVKWNWIAFGISTIKGGISGYSSALLYGRNKGLSIAAGAITGAISGIGAALTTDGFDLIQQLCSKDSKYAVTADNIVEIVIIAAADGVSGALDKIFDDLLDGKEVDFTEALLTGVSSAILSIIGQIPSALSQKFMNGLFSFWNQISEIFEGYEAIGPVLQQILQSLNDVIFVDIPKLIVADVAYDIHTGNNT